MYAGRRRCRRSSFVDAPSLSTPPRCSLATADHFQLQKALFYEGSHVLRQGRRLGPVKLTGDTVSPRRVQHRELRNLSVQSKEAYAATGTARNSGSLMPHGLCQMMIQWSCAGICHGFIQLFPRSLHSVPRMPEDAEVKVDFLIHKCQIRPSFFPSSDQSSLLEPKFLSCMLIALAFGT